MTFSPGPSDDYGVNLRNPIEPYYHGYRDGGGDYDREGVLEGYSMLNPERLNVFDKQPEYYDDEAMYGYGRSAALRSPAYMPDRELDLMGYPDVRDYEKEKRIAEFSASARKTPSVSRTTKNTSFVKNMHQKIRSKYSGSVSIAETFSTPKSKFRTNPRYRDVPQELSAHVVDQELDSDSQVIHINETEFLNTQKDLFGRSERDVKQIRARASKHIFNLTGINFSVDANLDVEKYRSSLLIKEGKGKSATPVAKLSPYTIGSNVSWKVDVANGFPSIKEKDRLVEVGYVFNVLKPSGIKVHGSIGGKEGKKMMPGESLYFCDFMIRPGRGMRKPVWIRARSVTPSEKVDDYERKAELKIGYMSLFQDGRAGSLMDYTGTAERSIRIEPVTVTSKAGKDAKSKAAEEKLTKKKKATASFVVHFDPTPVML
jgi:hypothetical protein